MAIEKIFNIRYVRLDTYSMVKGTAYIENSQMDIYVPEDDDTETPKNMKRFRFKVNMVEKENPNNEALGIIAEFDFEIIFEQNENDEKNCNKLAEHFLVNFKSTYNAKVHEPSLKPIPFILPTSKQISNLIMSERDK
jgi:hypothetical protein